MDPLVTEAGGATAAVTESAPVGIGDPEIDALLGIGLSEIRAVVTRRGHYKITIRAHSRFQLTLAGALPETETIIYKSLKIKGAEDPDANAKNIGDAVEIGLKDLSQQIADRHFD